MPASSRRTRPAAPGSNLTAATRAYRTLPGVVKFAWSWCSEAQASPGQIASSAIGAHKNNPRAMRPCDSAASMRAAQQVRTIVLFGNTTSRQLGQSHQHLDPGRRSAAQVRSSGASSSVAPAPCSGRPPAPPSWAHCRCAGHGPRTGPRSPSPAQSSSAWRRSSRSSKLTIRRRTRCRSPTSSCRRRARRPRCIRP
jgi:hypothetical protein